MRPVVAPPAPAGLTPGPVPTFSVIIPVYQAAATIAEAVESALTQTVPPHEVIVCDDGSTDDIDAALRPYRDRIIPLRKDNGGAASARNAAMLAASGDFLSLLDADDLYEPDRLEALGELASARPDLDILTTDSYLEVRGRVTARFSEGTPFAANHQRQAILERCFITHPAIRRTTLIGVGGFDESLQTGEDWDCWIRMLFAGATAGLVDAPLYRYRINEASLTTSGRVGALRDRVTLSERALNRDDLTRIERQALKAELRRRRARAAFAEAEAALRRGAPDARRRALSVVVTRGFGPAIRAQALAAVIAPRAAGEYMERREARTGHSVLKRIRG